jgi:hypothetical protein
VIGSDARVTEPYVIVHRSLSGEVVAELQSVGNLSEALSLIHTYADHLRAKGASGEVAIFNRTTESDVETMTI